ncbi:type I-E CRISPR-associated protein Cse1/CasA [Streptomyces sp. YIM 98790]|uniref:type I-E CRISPR-associated protein Cse1/CasA n=1 Tax=Streptomyces sp. YIM 98790 TaxID=2689077 RepID=UPI001408BD78|nr:type I-E CRISPR-associated protein Cse1/CasA [Streptomyces sp. YIM 98790]
MPALSPNVLHEEIFPVIWLPGHTGPDRVGFRELLRRSHEIAGFAIAEPPAHAAVLRISYALTARVTGLDEAGEDDWEERRDDIVEAGRLPAEGIEEYLGRFEHRFLVFDPEGGRPWMQDPRLAEQCDPANTAGVDKLIVTRPSGNNHAWFRHGSPHSPELPTVSEAVLNMLVWHYYGPSGRCSSREVDGEKSASATAGPLRTALSYHPEGVNLFETLLAGLPKPPAGLRRAEDPCPWEREELPDPAHAPEPPVGPCARLTGCSQHALLLVPDADDPGLVADAYITWAYRTGKIPRDDPFLIWQISQAGNRYPRPADSRRALWRDLDALLLHGEVGTSRAQRPVIFDTALDVSEDLRIRALGFEQENQAKDIQFMDASTPPILGHVEREAAHTAVPVARLRGLGDMYGHRLSRAVRQAWLGYVNDPKNSSQTWETEAEARYWPRAEQIFWKHFRALDRGDDGEGLDASAARKEFIALALQVYEHVTATAWRTDRGAQAVTTARTEIFGGRRKKTPKTP